MKTFPNAQKNLLLFGQSTLSLYLIFALGIILLVDFQKTQAEYQKSWKLTEQRIMTFEHGGTPLTPEDLNRGLKYYQRLQHRFPTEGLIYSGIGAFYFYRNDIPKAVASYETAIRLSPTLYTPYWDLGQIAYSLGDQRTAATYLKTSVELLNAYPLMLKNWGDRLNPASQYRFKDMITALQARANNDRNIALKDLAQIAIETKDIMGLQDASQQGLAVNPTDAEFNYFLGMAHFLRGKYAAAIERFGAAIRSDANFIEAYYYRGLCFKERGQDTLWQIDTQNAAQLKTQGFQERFITLHAPALHFNVLLLLLND